MAEQSRFAPGEVILHRMPFVDESGESGAPVISDVKPMVVIEDCEALVSLWLPAGTPTKLSLPIPRDRPKPWRPGEWELVDSAWSRWNTVFLNVPGQWRATWVWWTPGWEFLGWYVNLQEPFVRTALGFDVRDLQLDILVDPDGRWRWKDEADLERSMETGVISPAVAAATWAEARRAVADIESGAWPFTHEWRVWRPDPGWLTPTLPADEGYLKL